MGQAFIGLGSNEGDRLANLSQAIAALGRIPGIRVTQVATLFETKPVGGPEQEDFLNTVVELDTELTPQSLLEAVKQLERHMGRQPSSQRWGPRPIDLDILLYNDLLLDEEHLTIPHARLHERRFVLEPLSQLAPHVIHPRVGRSIAELLAQLPQS